ncbi:MAG: hypothetical protein KA116_11515, partial [Proteobacteria bacterium]|nr:hypothetical protein [Pseudomonadota bacterium]
MSASALSWVSDKAEDIDINNAQRVDLLKGDPIFGAVASLAVGRSPSPDSKFAIRKEHWRINPSINITSLLNDVSGATLPVGISVDVERGVSFYRRYEPQFLKSILDWPLNPTSHLPRSGFDVRDKIPVGTTVHIPARTRVSLGKGYSMSLLSSVLKDTLDIVTLRDLISATASISVEAKYDMLISRSPEAPNMARVQLIAAKEDSLNLGISTGIKLLLSDEDTYTSTGNKYGDKASKRALSKVTSKVMGKLLGQPLQLDFARSGDGVQTIFDYSYDLNNIESQRALTDALKGAGPLVDLKVMKGVSASGSSALIEDIFSPGFESSKQLSQDPNSGVVQNVVMSSERSYKDSGWRVGVNSLFRLGSFNGKSNSLTHSDGQSQLVMSEQSRKESQGPFGIRRESTNEDLSTHVGFDPNGHLIDSYAETIYKFDYSDKNFNTDSVNRMTAALRSKLGPDIISYYNEYPRVGVTQTGLGEMLERLRLSTSSGPGQFYKGQFQLEFRISPTYLFLTRWELKRGALQNGFITQAQQHEFISRWVAHRLKIMASRLGVQGLVTMSDHCVSALANHLGMYFLIKNSEPPYLEPGLEEFRTGMPWGCKETYQQLALPTIIDFINDRPEEARYGPRYSIVAQAEGKRKSFMKGESN